MLNRHAVRIRPEELGVLHRCLRQPGVRRHLSVGERDHDASHNRTTLLRRELCHVYRAQKQGLLSQIEFC